MKLTEAELRELLAKNAKKRMEIPVCKGNYQAPCCNEKKMVPVTIDGLTKECTINAADVVEDVLAYKKAHKPQRNDECTCERNTDMCKCEAETCEDLHCTNSDAQGHDESHVKVVDGVLNFDDNYKTPYEKMSYKEQEELKDLLEKSKRISSLLSSNSKPITMMDLEAHSFGEIDTQMFPDEKLIKEWKEYKSRVEAYMKKHPKLPKAIVKAMMLDEYPEDEHPVDGRPWEVQEFEKITSKMFDTYQKKNADYGSSFDDLFDEFGMMSALLRMKDKYNRLKSITEKNNIQVKDESVEDTLLDLANYAILTVIKLRKDKLSKK